MLTLHDRALGCLLAGACGDALGAPVEFISDGEIRLHYGAAGIREITSAYGVRGAVTDDTQMALFTVEGITRALREGGRTDREIIPAVHRAYRRWLLTQEQGFDPSKPRGKGLYGEPRMWARRAPGITCMS